MGSGIAASDARGEPKEDASRISRTTLFAGFAIGLIALGGGAIIEAARLGSDPVSLLSRLGGAIAFIAAFAVVCGIDVKGKAWRSGVMAGAAAVVAHAQIETTFYHPGASAACLLLIGAAACGVQKADTPRGRWSARISIGSAGVLAVALAAVSVPALRAETALGTIGQRLAGAPAGDIPARRAAAGDLVGAAPAFASDDRFLEAAFAQNMVLGVAHDDAESLSAAGDIARSLSRRHVPTKPKHIAFVAEAAEAQARSDAAPDAWQGAIEARRELARRDPHGVQTHLRLADTLAAAGRADEAAAVYRRTLELNENWGFDELKQLTDRERHRVRAYLARLSSED